MLNVHFDGWKTKAGEDSGKLSMKPYITELRSRAGIDK